MTELTQLRTENGKLFDAGEDAKTGRPSYTLEARTGPIHYKEAYKDTDPWLDLDESYSESSEIKGIGRVLVYPRLPNIVTVFQDICGYQIQSRSNPDHVAKVELVSIDGQEVTAWQDSSDLKTTIRIHPYRVGIWKDFSGASKAKVTTMRWKVTELGNAINDSRQFAFIHNPEAFSTADLTAINNPVLREQAKVAIETTRTRVDDQSWYWDELIPATAKLVDVDWQVGSGGNDGRVFYRSDDYKWTALIDNVSAPHIGYESSIQYKDGGFARFTNIGISRTATINSAKITLCCRWAYSNNYVKARITGHKVANSVAPTSMSEYASMRGTVVGGESNEALTSQISWNNVEAWSSNSWYDTPSIISPVQEIIDLQGWVLGNALLLFIDDHEDQSTHSNCVCRSWYQYEDSSSKAAKLSITWTEPTTALNYYYYNNMRP